MRTKDELFRAAQREIAARRQHAVMQAETARRAAYKTMPPHHRRVGKYRKHAKYSQYPLKAIKNQHMLQVDKRHRHKRAAQKAAHDKVKNVVVKPKRAQQPQQHVE